MFGSLSFTERFGSKITVLFYTCILLLLVTPTSLCIIHLSSKFLHILSSNQIFFYLPYPLPPIVMLCIFSLFIFILSIVIDLFIFLCSSMSKLSSLNNVDYTTPYYNHSITNTFNSIALTYFKLGKT